MTWLTVEEFAEWASTPVSSVRRKCRSGEYPSRKFGRRWKIDKDLFIEQARAEMIQRMQKKKITIPRINANGGEWLAKKKAELKRRIEVEQ